MDKKDLGHLIHLLVVPESFFFFMSNTSEILCNKSLRLQHFNHFCEVTNYFSGCFQHCSLKSFPCIPVIWEMFPFLYRNGLGSKSNKRQLFFHNSDESALRQHPSLWSFFVTSNTHLWDHYPEQACYRRMVKNEQEPLRIKHAPWYLVVQNHYSKGVPIEFLVWDNLLIILIALMRGGMEWGWHLGKLLFLSYLAIVQQLCYLIFI